jgi:hypothetical protein
MEAGEGVAERPKPSEERGVPWIIAERLHGDYPRHTPDGGKWLLFMPAAHVDEVWEKVRAATEEGLLGGSSKVSTARPNHYLRSTGTRVICVYTYDWTDEADVRRVRARLRDLGFVARLSYKADADSRARNYAGQSQGRIAKYYE